MEKKKKKRIPGPGSFLGVKKKRSSKHGVPHYDSNNHDHHTLSSNGDSHVLNNTSNLTELNFVDEASQSMQQQQRPRYWHRRQTSADSYSSSVSTASRGASSVYSIGSASSMQSFNSTIAAQAQHQPLPNGWEQQVSDEGFIYFVDHSIQKTTWTDPRTNRPAFPLSLLKPVHENVPSDDSINMETLSIERNGHIGEDTSFDHGISEISGGDDGSYDVSAAMAAAGMSRRGSSASVSSNGGLPYGWQRALTSDGAVYFIDHVNKTTTWRDPVTGETPSAEHFAMLQAGAQTLRQNCSTISLNSGNSPQSHDQSMSPCSGDLASTNAINRTLTPQKVKLPYGWAMDRTSDGRIYYINHLEKKTSWKPPPGAVVIDSSESTMTSLLDKTQNLESLLSENIIPLPTNWEKVMTPYDIPLFINHDSKMVTWIDPRSNVNIQELYLQQRQEAIENQARELYNEHQTLRTSTSMLIDKEARLSNIRLELLRLKQEQLKLQQKILHQNEFMLQKEIEIGMTKKKESPPYPDFDSSATHEQLAIDHNGVTNQSDCSPSNESDALSAETNGVNLTHRNNLGLTSSDLEACIKVMLNDDQIATMSPLAPLDNDATSFLDTFTFDENVTMPMSIMNSESMMNSDDIFGDFPISHKVG